MGCPTEGGLCNVRETYSPLEGQCWCLCVWMPLPKLDARVEVVGHSDSDWARVVLVSQLDESQAADLPQDDESRFPASRPFPEAEKSTSTEDGDPPDTMRRA